MRSLTEALALVRGEREEPGLSGSRLRSEFPDTLRALRLLDADFGPKRPKGFGLVKRETKKTGFVYYVRYCHEGKMLPSKWNTHTGSVEEAERFARENRGRLVGEYLKRHNGRDFKILEGFFREDSAYLACEQKRSRALSESTRKNYEAVITRKFLPFLKAARIFLFEKITAETLSDFQDALLAGGIKPQTVNDHLKAVRKVFRYVCRKGIVKENPCRALESIPVQNEDRKERGCYELGKLRGVFNRQWQDHISYLLCLMIYTTGMRNEEINRIRPCDIISPGGCRFIDVKESKTENGIRLVPLHERVYEKLKSRAKGKKTDEYIFGDCSAEDYSRAGAELARRLGMSGEAKKQNITFYSGRHFWKTLMNSEGLGEDVEEIFMGHKVSGDVAKLYNHRDKQGKKLMIKKARQVFSILDRRIFSEKPARIR
jgi:integrase